MTWYEVFQVTFTVFLAIGGMFVVPFVLVHLIDKLTDSYRRKKHPEYFKYWDEAKAQSFKNGAEFRERKNRFDYYMKLYNDGLRDGECTEEYYSKQMHKHMEEYKELCQWFRAELEKTRELLLKADLYAKEHNCMWGIIYDTKR